MQLLVSVASPEEVKCALAGGADIVDAKEPSAGPLGRVTLPTIAQIADELEGQRPLSVALGDLDDPDLTVGFVRAYAAQGANIVKFALPGMMDASRAGALIEAAAGAARDYSACVVAAIYADEDGWIARPGAFADVAANAGARGILLDTARKEGPGIMKLLPLDYVALWIRATKSKGLSIAIAGRLSSDDVVALRSVEPDIVGVRGAVCEGGRAGRVVTSKVALLRTACEADRPSQSLV